MRARRFYDIVFAHGVPYRKRQGFVKPCVLIGMSGHLAFFPVFPKSRKTFLRKERVHDLGRSALFSDTVSWFTPFIFDCCEGMICLVPGGFFTQTRWRTRPLHAGMPSRGVTGKAGDRATISRSSSLGVAGFRSRIGEPRPGNHSRKIRVPTCSPARALVMFPSSMPFTIWMCSSTSLR